MIKIDRNRMLWEIALTANMLKSDPPKSIIVDSYASLYTINTICGEICNKKVDMSLVIDDQNEFKRLMNKSEHKACLNFCKFTLSNQSLLRETFLNYLVFFESNEYDDQYLLKCRNYSEKDFKELIMSYYATFGSRTEKIVKRAFDEERIEFGYDTLDEQTKGLLVSQSWLKSYYIMLNDDIFNSLTASFLVHELGHAFDMESFVFSQQKKHYIQDDYLSEIASTAFEISFLDYLQENMVDVDGGITRKNNRLLHLYNYAYNVIAAYIKESLILYPDGIAEDEDGLYHYLAESIIYGLGYYFAEHLNLIRKESPKEFIRVLNNIITQRKEMTLEQSIELLGISVDDFKSGKYIYPKIEEDVKRVRKRFKYEV